MAGTFKGIEMALTPWQQTRAVVDGGKAIADRKSGLARVSSSLTKLIKSAATEDLHGLLTEKEINQLITARNVVVKVTEHLAKDAAQAKRIKAEWNRRYDEARFALYELPHQHPEDILALADLADELGSIERFLSRSSQNGLEYTLPECLRNAMTALSYQAARQKTTSPAAWVHTELAPKLPQAKAKLAGLVAKVNAMAVQKTLERAAA